MIRDALDFAIPVGKSESTRSVDPDLGEHSFILSFECERWIVLLGASVGLALLTVWGAGCASELTCRELGCAPGETCNASTGQCEASERDCTETGCPEGEVCDPEQGLCRPESRQCPERDCPPGQICNSQIGFCQPEPNCQRDQCPSPAETCNEETGECIPQPCERDEACAAGYVCDSSNTCRRGCRLEQPDCPAGTICRPVPDSSRGLCLSECTSNQECPYGQACVSQGGRSVCEIEPPCQEDGDCRSDEVCRQGNCGAPPCRSNEDCSDPRVCDRATGQCVGEGCSDDLFAPNYTREAAADLDIGAFTSLELCPGRTEWFELDVASATRLVFRLEHAARYDLDLALFNARGRRLAINQQTPGRRRSDLDRSFASRLQWTADRSRTVFMRIDSHPSVLRNTPERQEGITANYELEIERDTPRRCDDDSFEENDRRAEATELSTRTDVQHLISNKRLCGDEDWYVLRDLQSEQHLSVTFEGSSPRLRATLLSSSGGRATIDSNTSRQIPRLGVEGSWWIRVDSERNTLSEYSLQYEVEANYECPASEMRSSLGDAFELEPGQREETYFCPRRDEWEVDWYVLDAPPLASTLRLQLEATSSLPPLDVTLFERTSEGLARLRRAEHSDDSTYLIERLVDRSHSLVLRIGTSASLSSLFDPPSYSVSYRYESN